MTMLNKVELIGNVGADAATRNVGEGRKAANLNLATHRRWKDKNGNRQEDTQWHPVVFWGKQAELAERLLKKGQLVYVEGRLNHTSWTDGEDRTHYRTEVTGESFLVLSPKSQKISPDPPAVHEDD